MGRFAGIALTIAIVVSSALAGAAQAGSRQTEPGPVPGFVAELGGSRARVILVPGTGDPTGSDQVGRTDAWWEHQRVTIVPYPAAFGIRVGPIVLGLIGNGTFDDSEAIGTRAATRVAKAAAAAGRPVIINGFSQGANIAMNAAHRLVRSGAITPRNLTVVLGADPRFPNTGVEALAPSMVPGVTTDGPREPSDMTGVRVVSYCIRGDSMCGLANPMADPIAAAFYFAPGYYVHAFMYPKVGSYRQVKTWRDGDTEYHVYDGGNPVGIMLRDMGVPVDKRFDDAVSRAVRVPMPGVAATRHRQQVPTPRMLQKELYRRFGWQLPVTDPDQIGAQRRVKPVARHSYSRKPRQTGLPRAFCPRQVDMARFTEAGRCDGDVTQRRVNGR
ncbi:hypothetical protein GOEFS_092_00040 [Gordonia effusa NBRC 100432]|uniref:PE-PPE domain-containing protein n=1 Tax=Gordonia effusa NBRC 100432 TaxID=1077974 RepID=H0R3C8_9ACTN|nr:PE-PPE domain-containing protein [Gordonia effusa]GAB19579.1 hypothetical protein GOEFS_092_00040 [Gordonia effusa NBRC 100432]